MNALATLLKWLAPLLQPLTEFRGNIAKLTSVHQDSVKTFATLAGGLVETQTGPEAFTGQLSEAFWSDVQAYLTAERALIGAGVEVAGAGATGVAGEAAVACEECATEITGAAEVAAAAVAGDAALEEVTGVVDVAAVAEGGANPIADVAAGILTLIVGAVLVGTLIKLGWDIFHAIQSWMRSMQQIGDQPLPVLPPNPKPVNAQKSGSSPVTPQPLTPEQKQRVQDLMQQFPGVDQSVIEDLVKLGYDDASISAILRGVPTDAIKAANYAKLHSGAAQPGYVGDRPFANDGRDGGQVLPKTTPDGTAITYREYDTHPYTKGVNRGAERIVIGSDGSVWYTNDHYKTFTQF